MIVSADGRCIVSDSGENTIKFWNIAKGRVCISSTHKRSCINGFECRWKARCELVRRQDDKNREHARRGVHVHRTQL